MAKTRLFQPKKTHFWSNCQKKAKPADTFSAEFRLNTTQPPATNMHTSLARSLAHPFIQDCPMLSSFFWRIRARCTDDDGSDGGGVGVRWRCDDDQLRNKPGTFHHTICLCINLHSSQTIASLAYFIVVQLISRLIRTERQNKQFKSKGRYHLWLKHKTRLKRQLWTLGIESQFWILPNSKSSISSYSIQERG